MDRNQRRAAQDEDVVPRDHDPQGCSVAHGSDGVGSEQIVPDRKTAVRQLGQEFAGAAPCDQANPPEGLDEAPVGGGALSIEGREQVSDPRQGDVVGAYLS